MTLNVSLQAIADLLGEMIGAAQAGM